jgi:hypothetical protein
MIADPRSRTRRVSRSPKRGQLLVHAVGAPRLFGQGRVAGGDRLVVDLGDGRRVRRRGVAKGGRFAEHPGIDSISDC